MMKTGFFGFCLMLLLAGCAAISSRPGGLYDAYSEYERQADEKNITALADRFFSSTLLGENYRSNPDAAGQLLFKQYMVVEKGHYERIGAQSGCLTINGYDRENSPLIISLKYVPGETRWLIDGIHVVFIESDKAFAHAAKCPDEYPE